MDKNKTVEEEAAYFHPVLKFVSRSSQSKYGHFREKKA